MGGSVVAAIKAPAVHMLAAIPAGESMTWTGSYRITSFDLHEPPGLHPAPCQVPCATRCPLS